MLNNFDSFWERLVQMSLLYMETARKNEKQTNFGSLFNSNGVKIYENWHPSKRSAQNKNRTLSCMQTKPFGIFINDYNLSRTTRKSVKINSTSASLLCNLCFFPHKTGQNDRETTESLLQHSCALHSGKFEKFLRGRTLPLQKIEKFYKSRSELAFCQKTRRSCRLASW